MFRRSRSSWPLAAALSLGLGLAVLPAVWAGESGSGFHLPFTDAARGKALFVDKGCVVCHAVNGVGGTVGPALDADPSGAALDPFDFAARMWRGAREMIILQELEAGIQIELSGEELAHIARFLGDLEAQRGFTEEDVPEIVRRLMESERVKELEL